MSFWFVLWLVLLLALMYFLGWTFVILLRQKAAWQKYAAARKLRYKPGALMASPEMEGVIDDHTISFFSSEHLAEEARGSRKLTAVEVRLASVMPIEGGVASGGMIDILKGVNLKQEYSPEHSSWSKAYMAAGSSRPALGAYLSDARVASLCGLMRLKNAWVILIFRDDAMLLRVDVADPLDSAAKVDKLAKQMLAAAKVLELAKGEAKALKVIADRPAYDTGDDDEDDVSAEAGDQADEVVEKT